MRTIKNFLMIGCLALITILTSCSGEDGERGATGAAGADGNANAKTYLIDVSAESGTGFEVNIPEITQAVIDKDVILTYLKIPGNLDYALPGPGPGGSYLMRSFLQVGSVFARFLDFDGNAFTITAGTFSEMKVVIIESSFRSAGTPTDVLEDLENANIDVNNYDEVAGYYGLEK